jgi:transcriptional regulator
VDLLNINMSKADARLELLQGTLDLLILKTLASMGQQHGYGIARRIEQLSTGSLTLNQGTLYPAMLRLEQRGLVSSEIGVSDNNRRARFYSITTAGRAQLQEEIELWKRMSATVETILNAVSGEGAS